MEGLFTFLYHPGSFFSLSLSLSDLTFSFTSKISLPPSKISKNASTSICLEKWKVNHHLPHHPDLIFRIVDVTLYESIVQAIYISSKVISVPVCINIFICHTHVCFHFLKYLKHDISDCPNFDVFYKYKLSIFHLPN